MAYRKQALSQYKGRFSRTIGKILAEDGKSVPKRFLLGTNREAAEIANRRLEKLWSEVEADFRRRRQRAAILRPLDQFARGIECEPLTGQIIEKPVDVLDVDPVWESHTLVIADAVRKNEHEVVVAPSPALPARIVQPDKNDYVHRIMELRERYSVVTFVPSDHTLYARQLLAIKSSVEGRISKAEAEAHRTRALTNVPMRTSAGRMLHGAIEAYAVHVEQTGQGGDNESADARSLKGAIADMPLASFDYDAIQKVGDYWRSRPASKRYGANGAPISVNTVRNRLKTTRRFIRWLNRSSKWDWQAPVEWAEALRMDEQRIQTEEERLNVAAGPDTWNDKELMTLYTYATDRDRLFLLFGLNLGFAQSEVISFRHQDIKLELDPPRIERVRRKTGKYFEAALWPETQKALQWLAKHRSRKVPADDPWVLHTEKGTRFDGNSIANRWNALLRRVRMDYPDFRQLPFKYLRKTAYQLVLEASESHEVAGAFEGRGKISSDEFESSYGRRVFKLVFEANAKVRDRLQSMFAAAPDAFTAARSKGSPNITARKISQIRQLGREGLPALDIANKAGVSRQTVYRWIEEANPKAPGPSRDNSSSTIDT